MKKIILFAIGILTSVTTLAEVDTYTDENTGLKYEYDTDTHEAKLTDGSSITKPKVDFILSEFDVDGITYTVKRIGEKAFTTYDTENKKYVGNTIIEHVVIPDNVTKIEANAFCNCSNIVFLELPSTITDIATNAFTGCSRMSYVCCKVSDANNPILSSLPKNELMTLFVPDGCAKNDDNGYLNPNYHWADKDRFSDRIYEGDMKVVYSKIENMTYVCATGKGKQAIITEGKRESDVVIKSEVKCDDGVTYNVVGIGKSAFYGFSELYTLKIQYGVTTISNMAFQRCSNLRKLELPSSLNTIGTNAFADCNNLRHVWCKVENATIIAATHFPNKGMMSLYVPNDDYKENGQWNTQFNGRIFKGDMMPYIDENGLEYVYCPQSNVATLYSGQDLNEIEIKSTIVGCIVTGIDRGAFNGYTKIRKVTIPSGITAIGSNAFQGCSNLILVDSKITTPFSIDDNVFSSKTKATLFVPTDFKSNYNNTTGWKFMDVEDCESMAEFPDGGMNYVGWTKKNQKYAKLIKGVLSITNIGPTTSNGYSVIAIGESAFSGISSLENLSIAEGIKRIEANAFKNCRDLGSTSLSLPSSLEKIGASAFQGCTGLKIVTLPANISTIGDKAFKDCTNLVEVVSNMSNPIEITSTTFPDDGLILYKPSSWTDQQYKEKGWNFFHDFTGNKYPVTKSDLTYVCGDADPSERKEMILLTNNLTNESDVTVTIPTNVPETDKKVIAIAKNAFLRNTKLKDVNISEGVKNIGSYAFRGCSKLTTITLPSSLTDISDYAFDQCTNITKITSKIEGSNLFILQEHVFPAIVPTIYIPFGSSAAYKNKEGWKRFENSFRVGEATHNVKPDNIGYMFYDCYSEEDGNTATLTKIQWAEGITSITVPTTITVTKNEVQTVYTVTAVAESIFEGTDENKAKFSSLVIEEGIKTIGSNAFKNWRGLTSITLPKSLTTIGQSAFQGNNNANFITINIPENVETIGSYAFQGCSNLKTVTLPDKLNSIDEYAFANLSSLENLVIPNNVDMIGAYAFSGCTKLRIVLPNKLKNIGDYAFEYNKATDKLEIPEGVETIGIYAFNECTNMQELVLSSSLTKIDYYAFTGCAKLTTIISKIKKDDIFDVDKDVFPESVRNAATLFVPIDDVTENEEENEGSKTIASYRGKEGWKEFLLFEVGEKKIYTDDNTKMVYECLTGPLTATLIGTQLTDKDDVTIESTFAIINDEDVITYKVKEIAESAFSIDKNPNTKDIKTITIAEGITKVGANAFKGCSGLTTIDLPATLKTIGNNAFYGCSNLVNIVFQHPSTLETIGISAFQGCSSLKKLDLPSSLKYIKKSAFKSCTNLQKVWLPSSLKLIDEEAFYGCGLTNVNIEHDTPLALNENVFSITNGNTATLFVPKNKKTNYNTADGWNKFSNIVEGEFVEAYTDDVKKMTFSCYTTTDDNNKTVNAAIITKSTTSSLYVKVDEFYNAVVSESEETIPYQVVAIGKYAFNTCTNIKSLELPSSLRSIGSSAFGGCSKLREIISDVDKKDLFKIDDNVFHVDVKSLATLYVPIDSKDTYEKTEDWSNFVHEHIVNGKWMQTTNPDGYYLKYRYHTGEQIATVIEIVFPDNKKELTIPSTLTIGEGENAVIYNIDSIAPGSFTNKDKVKILKIQDAVEGKPGIKTIDANAFNACKYLETVFLPASLDKIGEKAFSGCPITNLNFQRATSFDINANVFSLSEGNKATLFVRKGTGNSYNKDGWNKFSNVVEGVFVDTYEGSIENVKDMTFSYYTTTDAEDKPINAAIITKSKTSKNELPIPASVTINETVYYIKAIGSYSFSESNNLTNLTISNGIETIGKYAFNTCTGLKSIELPQSLTSIGSSAFGGCSKLREIVCDVDKDPMFEITDDVFHTDTKSQAILYVPLGWKFKYENAAGWTSFVHDHIENGKWLQTTDPDDYYLKYKYHTGKNKASVIEIVFPENEEKLTIPSTFTISEGQYAGQYDIETIAPVVFQNKEKVKKLMLPASLKSIGSKAFNGCSKLTRLCIESIPTMDNEDAFSTYGKTILFVPTGTLSTIEGKAGWSAFTRKYEGYYDDESPDGVDRAYIYLKQTDDKRTAILTKSSIADPVDKTVNHGDYTYTVTIIGESAFNDAKLVNLDLPETITDIEKCAFQGQKNLEAINLSSSLKSIGDDAFQGCNNLQKIVFPASLKSIGKRTFSDNTKLNDLTISEGIESIDDNAFKNCINLKNVVLPSTLTRISDTAFDGCSNLTEVISKIKDENVVSKYKPSAPNAILYVPDGTVGLYDGWRPNFLYVIEGNREYGLSNGLNFAYTNTDKKAILLGVDKEGVVDGAVTIPPTVTLGDKNVKCDVIAIDKDAFKEIKTEVKTLTIGKNIKTIAEGAFDSCSNLAEIICEDYFKIVSDLSQTDVILYVPNPETKNMYVDAGWNSEHIYIGKRKTRAEGGLLYAYATGGNEATLIGVTDDGIDNGAVTIPGIIEFKINESDEAKTKFNVVAIANSVFKDNTDVKLVSIGENIRSIGEKSFEGCANLKEVVSNITDPFVVGSISSSIHGGILYVPSNDDDLVAAYYGWNFPYTLVGERKTETGNGLYYVCATIDKKAILVEGKPEEMNKDVEIPGSISGYDVIAIYDKAFSGNVNMKSVKIENSVKAIGASAFQGCIALNKIWLSESLDSIADKAFYGCTDIDYICTKRNTPLTTPAIGKNAFPKFKSTSTLYVPFGYKDAYSKDTEFGGKFSIIKEGYFEGDFSQDGLTYECIVDDKNEKVAMVAKAAATVTDPEILSEVQLNNETYTVTTIYKEAFKDCKNLKTIIFPKTLKTIEDKAFEQCTKLLVITSRIAKDNLFTFNDNVFLQTVYDNATVYILNDAETETKYKATDGWKNFKNWAKGEKKTKTLGSLTYDYLVGVGTATLTKAAIDNEKVVVDGTVNIDGEKYTVTAIGANAFKDCKKLKKVWLPSTLSSIDATAFTGSTITHVSSQVNDPALISENVFPTSAILFVPTGKKSDYSNAKFSYVAEGEFVDELVDNGFTYNCLKSNKAILMKYTGSSNDVVIPGSVKLGSDSYSVSIIAKPAFASKSGITSLVIPAGVVGIDAETFSACNSLKWIESKIDNPISISSNVFANYNATLFIPSDKVTEYENKGWKFLNIYVGDRKETPVIAGCTYVYSTGDKKAILTNVSSNDKEVTVNGTFTIGNDEYTVTAIAESVFKGKTKMVSLKISENIENIGANAFQNCTKLEKVEFPATLKKIGNKAFDGCIGLVSLTCDGKEPAEIGADAFPSYTVTVNVPKDAVETYKNHQNWKLFGDNILGITTSVTDDTDGVYMSGEDGNAKIWNGTDAKGDFVIQEEVMINGTVVQVTAIDDGAFEGDLDLTGVTIPVTVKSIGASAFAGCSNLKSVTVYWNDPIALGVAGARGSMTRSSGSSIFEGVNLNTCILYVPAGCVEKYRNAAVWGDFKNILEIGTTAINGVVISEGGKPFDIYNIQGRKVRDNVTTFDGLPSGVYIVNGKKVMVK